ncbi:MAG: hypothetical protein Q4G68_05680 [Planctomycetia bacterium]|nr:hypothetical protein [Planctomycetia bacterium]
MRQIRSLGLILAFLVGFSVPGLHEWIWLVPWFVRLMLFTVFVECRLDLIRIRRSHFALLFANLAIGMAGCALFRMFNCETLAQTAYFLGIAPTAISAPAIMECLKGKVEYVITAFLLSTAAVAASLPFCLPWAVGSATPGAFLAVCERVGSVIVLPVVAALLLRFFVPASIHYLKKLNSLILVLWMLTVAIICSGASAFMQSEVNVSRLVLLVTAVVSMVFCLLQFSLGYLLGERGYRREASQSLGQKNTSICIYLALTFANPLVALGPTFYVVWHNLWNAWQMGFNTIDKPDVQRETRPGR